MVTNLITTTGNYTACRQPDITEDYWRLLEITGGNYTACGQDVEVTRNYKGLLEITGDYWRQLYSMWAGFTLLSSGCNTVVANRNFPMLARLHVNI